jgi:hypothetical protein
LLSPSGQAPSANVTRQSRRLRTPPTRRLRAFVLG